MVNIGRFRRAVAAVLVVAASIALAPTLPVLVENGTFAAFQQLNQKFDGARLWRQSVDAISQTHIALVEPEKRAAFRREWLNKHDNDGTFASEERTDAAIAAMLGSLKYMHDGYLPAREAKAFMTQARGQQEGIGVPIGLVEEIEATPPSQDDAAEKPLPKLTAEQIEALKEAIRNAPPPQPDPEEFRITSTRKMIVVKNPEEGTPAHGKIFEGDQILEVDGVPVEGMMLDEAVDKIRGQAGTDVRITVMRTVDGASTVQSFPITRAVIRHKAVHVRDLGDGITHIKLDSFMSETVAEQVKAALEEAVKGKGIIFDLRGNPGGELGNAIDVASFFLPDGTLLVQRERTPAGMVEVHTSVNSKWKTVITTNPRDAENLDIKVHPRAPLVVPTDMPVILLIDGGSASASDIFAGVMKAHRRMIVIGDTSFGKDVGQAVIPLLYGRAMKVTAFDFLPAGESMNGVGILPHVVADSENAEDEAVKRIKPLIAAAEAMKERQQKLEENRRAR